jgi:hypothetical protein
MRRLRGRIIGLAKKPLLDLCGDLGQPFFCTVGSMLMILEVSLKVPYALFGTLQLVRKFLRYVDCVVVVFFTYLSRLVKESQNVLPRDVQPICSIQSLVFSRRRKWDHRFWFTWGMTTTRNPTTHRTTTSREF